MTDKTIESIGKVGGDYFRLYYSRKGGKKLDCYLDLFDPNDYYIYKTTRWQKEVTYQNLIEFKYASYTFLKKSLYSSIEINRWMYLFYYYKIVLNYLIKPTPPIDLIERIEFRK